MKPQDKKKNGNSEQHSPVIILLAGGVEESQLDVVSSHGNIHSVVIKDRGNIFPGKFVNPENNPRDGNNPGDYNNTRDKNNHGD